METITEIPIVHPFWRKLPPQYLPRLKREAVRMHFEQNQQIFQTDAEADRFYLLETGCVALETPFLPGRGVVQIQTVEAGEALGWSWFFPPYHWHFGARALVPSDLITIDAHFIRDEVERDHDFGYEIAIRIGEVLFRRLETMRTQLLQGLESRR